MSTKSNQVTDEQILKKIAEGDRPYTTAKRLAELLPISQQATGQRLRKLAQAGKVERDKISANGVLYLLPDSETPTPTDS